MRVAVERAPARARRLRAAPARFCAPRSRADPVDRERLADDLPTVMRGLSEARDPGRSSASRAAVPDLAAREPSDIRPSKRPARSSARRAAGAARPSVDLPQPDSPTSPRVSPRRRRERRRRRRWAAPPGRCGSRRATGSASRARRPRAAAQLCSMRSAGPRARSPRSAARRRGMQATRAVERRGSGRRRTRSNASGSAARSGSPAGRSNGTAASPRSRRSRARALVEAGHRASSPQRIGVPRAREDSSRRPCSTILPRTSRPPGRRCSRRRRGRG